MFEIKPDIAHFDELGEKSKEGWTYIKPQYLVEPQYMEGNLEGSQKT